jgi:hypothetical protein
MLSAKLIFLVALAQIPSPEPDAAALVKKLGSASYAERDATKSLENLGSKALPALRSSLNSEDAEVRSRARAMIDKIEGNLLLQESLVRLDFHNATLDDVVKSISKQVGFEVGLGGRAPGLAGTAVGTRRITLSEPKPVSFWKAIDRLCEVGELTSNYQYQGQRNQGSRQPAVVLSYNPQRVAQPSSHHGPFHFSVISLSYQNTIFFQSSPLMVAQAPSSVPGIGGVAKKKSSRATIPPSAAGAPARAAAEGAKAGNAPSRDVRFSLQIRVTPEPRMVFNGNGNVKLLEAVDELGNSLTSNASDDERAFGPIGMAVGMMMDGPIGNLTIHLRRPESPGKLIKTLRGTIDTSVTSPRSNPLVIPLKDAAGKTFNNGDQRVVVNSIDRDSTRGQETIELKFDDLDEVFPAEPARTPGRGLRTGMMGGGLEPRMGSDPSQWPIQLLTANGQYVFCATKIDRDSGRVTLTLPPMNQMNDASEIRISSIVRAIAKIPFEFHDLPMP